MCAAGSLPVGDGMPPVSFTQRRMRGRLMPCMLSGPPNCRRRCGAPRMSIQRMQSVSGAPASSTGTVPSLWVLQQTAATSAAGPSWRARSRRVAATTARHQSSGRCSAPPPGSTISSTGSNSHAATRPSMLMSATFAPDVPRSTARTNREALEEATMAAA